MSEMQPTFRPAAEQKRILLIEDEMINMPLRSSALNVNGSA